MKFVLTILAILLTGCAHTVEPPQEEHPLFIRAAEVEKDIILMPHIDIETEWPICSYAKGMPEWVVLVAQGHCDPYDGPSWEFRCSSTGIDGKRCRQIRRIVAQAARQGGFTVPPGEP